METRTIHPALLAMERRHELAERKRLKEKLALLREFNDLLVESTGECILVIDELGRIISINQTGRRLLGLRPEEDVARQYWTGLFHGLETTPAMPLTTRHPAATAYQAASRSRSGEMKFWRITIDPFREAANQDRYLLIARDVTEQMLAEKALRKSEEAFRKIFEENPIGIILAALDCRITRVNNALGAMLGYSERELLGRDLRELPGSAARERFAEVERLIRGETPVSRGERILRTKRNQPVWAHVTTAVLRDAENAPFSIFQMVENIQDRKTTEEQVLAYQAQLQSLAAELSLGEERERRRIATELHDRIGQTLAFARIKLAGFAKEPNPGALEEIRDLIEQAMVDTRSLTFELSPPVLYELGFVAAIEWLTRKIQREHGIPTRFHDDGQPKPLTENARVVLFQAVRELLLNIVKHARASHAQVILRRDADALRLTIEDDGVGFEISSAAPRPEAPRTFGLFNIRERIEYLGGRVKMRSEPGHGTRVTLIAPLSIDGMNSHEC